MRSIALSSCHNSLRLFTRPIVIPTQRFSRTGFAKMSTGVPPSLDLGLETKNLHTAPGINLTEQQSTAVRSVLDLFLGKVTLQKLALWRDDATFTDPLCIAEGRDRYAAQWYGLQAAFSEIEQLSHNVTDAGNPILVDLKSRYVIKGINKEQIIQSVVAIKLDDQGKISRCEDRWDGSLPDGAISNAFRHLNAATLPKMVSVPKNEEEETKKGN